MDLSSMGPYVILVGSFQLETMQIEQELMFWVRAYATSLIPSLRLGSLLRLGRRI